MSDESFSAEQVTLEHQEGTSSELVPSVDPCTATEMIPTIKMISATEMIPNHRRNDSYLQSK